MCDWPFTYFLPPNLSFGFLKHQDTRFHLFFCIIIVLQTLDIVDNPGMEELLDMTGRMQGMEEFVAQHSYPILTGNQGLIPERSHNDARSMVLPPLAVPGLLLAAW